MGRQEGAIVSSEPTDVTSFFVGFTSLLFAFGGHTSNIEVADVMVSQVPQLLGLSLCAEKSNPPLSLFCTTLNV